MIIRHASQIGEPVIRKKSVRVVNARSAKTQKVVQDLIDSMRYHQLVGMAAPQIGVSQRIFVTEIRKTATRKTVKQLDSLRVFINPRIIHRSQQHSNDYEGCGSVAEATLFAPVRRPSAVTIQGVNERGEPFQLKATGLLARVLQHELDHLNGVVFLDHLRDGALVLDRQGYLRGSR